MGDKSKIEWTEATWNPVVGCSIVSPGCTNCYAMKFAGNRLDGNPKTPHYAGTTRKSKAGPVWTGKVALAPEDKLLEPLRWKRPRMIFVNSMGDLFHEDVPDEWIDQVFAVMALASQHTFQVLTKRAERMRAYLSQNDMAARIAPIGARMMEEGDNIFSMLRWQQWPLPNVWLGVSAEDQARANERIPHLLQTPAAVRFVSAEPLLGEISFEEAWHGETALDPECWGDCGWCMTGQRRPLYNCRLHPENADHEKGRSGLDWIIVGGESGPNARPMHPDWARSIRDQCQAAGVPFFFKQWGEHVTGYLDVDEFHVDEETHGPNVHWNGTAQCRSIPGEQGHYGRVGKRAAGRLLDGREHNEMPERASDA